MFSKGEVINEKFIVEETCSTLGGMGVLLFVLQIESPPKYRLVLKYCRESSDEQLKRFRREVRLLSTYEGNSKIVQLWDYDLEYDPPYYVMKYYEQGDLLSCSDNLFRDLNLQEQTILQMMECLHELHSRNEFHRDIKPQNFLVEDGNIVVSDFGLSTEVGSNTAFTRSSVYWGTHGYIPPEFLNKGGFKNADASGDIFMLGKTIYVLLTKRDPLYLVQDDIPGPLYHVIERCCAIDKNQRYQDLSELKQALVAVFDVLLDRGGGIGKAKQQLTSIIDRIEQDREYRSSEIGEFVEQLAILDDEDQIRICIELPKQFYAVIRQKPVAKYLPTFLNIYEKLVESREYSWSYAETIAENMKVVFKGGDTDIRQKVKTLELAIIAATYMNRYAAMDTCKSMVISINDEELGLEVGSLIMKLKDYFISEIEPSSCESDAIRKVLKQLQK